MRPIFEAWLAPFRDLGVATISIRNTGGTDHLSSLQVGLPGFQFIQDPLEYGSVTHHSNMDTYDHAVPADLMQAAGDHRDGRIQRREPSGHAASQGTADTGSKGRTASEQVIGAGPREGHGLSKLG